MVYEEPEEILGTSGDLVWLFEEHSKVGIQCKKELPPRDDIMEYNPEVHAKEIDDKVQWRGCLPEHRIVLRAIIENSSTSLPKKACRIISEASNSTLTQGR